MRSPASFGSRTCPWATSLVTLPVATSMAKSGVCPTSSAEA